MISEFANFIREKGIVGLAVGFVTGGAVSKTVTSLVTDMINPLIGAITGAAGDLASMTWTVPLTKITFKYGDFISNLIDLMTVLVVVYLVFVKSPLNKMDKTSVTK